MDTITSSVKTQQSLQCTMPTTPSSAGDSFIHQIKMLNYSPASPASSISSETVDISSLTPSTPSTSMRSQFLGGHESDEHFFTPKKSLADSGVLERIRGKLGTPSSSICFSGGDMQLLRPEHYAREEESSVQMLKNRFLISTQTYPIPPEVAAKTPSSYRHLIDRNASNLRCTDVFTESDYICKIINEPFEKVQRAYFALKHAGESAKSSIYGHTLIRNIHDVVPKQKNRTYLIFGLPQACEGADGIYEDLHSYIRNKRRLSEKEARSLFHQISETVLLCHQNGIILRDLKLKRFYFIDEARTKIQYESLEGSMILNDPADDTLSDKIGCPLYTAPELLCPYPTYRGKPADMWSLGVILYTMLVGQYPFYERGNCNLITIIRHCQVQIPENLSHGVQSLLVLLLSKNYKERLRADEVFMMPWMKKQKPFGNLYLHVDTNVDAWLMDPDVDVSDSDSDDIVADDVADSADVDVADLQDQAGEGATGTQAEKTKKKKISAKRKHYQKYCKQYNLREIILRLLDDGEGEEDEAEAQAEAEADCTKSERDAKRRKRRQRLRYKRPDKSKRDEQCEFDVQNLPLV